jgi:hypothetical protein
LTKRAPANNFGDPVDCVGGAGTGGSACLFFGLTCDGYDNDDDGEIDEGEDVD